MNAFLPSRMGRSEVEASSPSFCLKWLAGDTKFTEIHGKETYSKQSYSAIISSVLSMLIFQQCCQFTRTNHYCRAGGQVEVRKVLLVKDTSAEDIQLAKGCSGLVNNYILLCSSSIQRCPGGNVDMWVIVVCAYLLSGQSKLHYIKISTI